MSDDQNVNNAEFSDEMREAAGTCARIIKEHDFAVMGYEAEKVIDIYAKNFESGRLGPGEEISKDDAASLIRDEFEALYGQSPEEARARCQPRLDLSGVSSDRDEGRPEASLSRARLVTRNRDHEGHER
ncbi:MAG: hypothetical protein CME59_16060 [Halioglobus sp.]|nr:hypothetical protein [Halioglobus sp.]|tara:strand:- start:3551 stop:3937 length:387 start_codon:yes stop_codon:yes gene_type:complete